MVNEKMTAQQGLVISYFGNSVAIEAENRQIYFCYLRRNQETPVVGDQVIFQLENADRGIIKAILPRHSFLLRGSDRGHSKIIAANVDQMVIVMAPPPIFSEYLLDRYLIAAELLHIDPIIVLNKIDLLNEDERKKILETHLQSYHRIAYTVMMSSIYYEETLQALSDCLVEKTSVFMGPSGVGKSSIIAKLLDFKEPVRIQAVSKKGAGKHTTTSTHLYHFQKGGNLIDSPGVREFSLWRVEEQEIFLGFKEFQAFLGACRFRDCKHMQEPGCALKEAVLKGNISETRWISYQTLMKKIKDN